MRCFLKFAATVRRQTDKTCHKVKENAKKNDIFYFFRFMGDEVCLACSFFLILHCDLRKKEQAVGGVKREEEKSIVQSNPHFISFLALLRMALPILRSRPCLVIGMPVARAIFCLAPVMPIARFQENERPGIFMKIDSLCCCQWIFLNCCCS